MKQAEASHQRQRQTQRTKKRRKSTFTAQTITKAVTHHQVASLEQEQIKHRELFQTRVKQREMQADLRVRARLKERMEKKGMGRKKSGVVAQQQQQLSGGAKIVPLKSMLPKTTTMAIIRKTRKKKKNAVLIHQVRHVQKRFNKL
jgi:hypothetical protein